MLEDLTDFIDSNPDARELKRAVAVQMFLKGYKHREIGESIGVSSGFISKWTGVYEQLGVSGLKLGSRFCRVPRTGTTASSDRLVEAQELLESGGTASLHRSGV